jgi:hypothetical protein
MLLRLGSILITSDENESLRNDRRSFQISSRWALIFALLVPLQLIGYAWLWADSDNQINRQISRGESAVAELRSRILASGSQAELQTLLASANPGPLPPLKSGSLSDQKQQLSEAIAINTSQLSSKLREQRSAMLRSTLPGTMRVFFGATIVSAFFVSLMRGI